MKILAVLSTLVLGVTVTVVFFLASIPVMASPKTATEVTISSPDGGVVFEVGDVVTVRVLPQGEPENIPYRLLVRDGGLVTQTFEILSPDWLGVEQEFLFRAKYPGESSLTAYLEGADGGWDTDDVPCSVKPEGEGVPKMSSLSVPWFEESGRRGP